MRRDLIARLQILCIAVVLTLGGCVSQPAPPSGSSSGGQGRIVEAPHSVRAFRPSSNATATDTALRRIFDDADEDMTRWYQHVQTLSDPFFEGRLAGTRGFDLATEYVAFHLAQAGLDPAFNRTTSGPTAGYVQPFTYEGEGKRTISLRTSACDLNGRALEHGTDYTVLPISGGSRITAPVVFVGYGIEDGPGDYSSFDSECDLAGTIAMVLRYEPLDEQGRSQWTAQRFSPAANIGRKIRTLVERGVAGVILVTPQDVAEGEQALIGHLSDARVGDAVDVPVVHITPASANRLLEQGDAGGRSIRTLTRQVNSGDLSTLDLGENLYVTLQGIVEVIQDTPQLPSANVGAVLRGRGRLASEWIIVGGHYDHLGYGGPGAFPGGEGQLHPGADDNASGTAAVLILARRLAEAYARTNDDRRSVLFTCFGAEEVGLIGSAFMIDHPPVSLDRVTLMLNMDMIGRLRDDQLMISGSGTAAELDELLALTAHDTGLTFALSPGGRGPSDHSNFYNAGIPVISMFTGVHDDYHRPADVAHLVHPAGAVKVIDAAELIIRDVAARPQRLTFVTNDAEPPRVASRNRLGAPVRFGIMPSYSASLDTGVLVDGVGQGTSADLAGITQGDVLTAWNGEEITGGQRLADLLRESSPGDVIRVTLTRGDETMDVVVTLQARE